MTEEKRNLCFEIWLVFWFSLFTTIPFVTSVKQGHAAIIFLVSLVLYTILIRIWRNIRAPFAAMCRRPIRFRGIETWSDRRFLWTSMGVLMLLTLPAFLALFPATFNYDAPAQLGEMFGPYHWSTHHPLLHTLLFGKVLVAGSKLFSSNDKGLALYAALQAIAVTFAVARSLLYLRRRGTPHRVLIALVFVTGLNPFLQVLTFATTKDILFAAFLLLFAVYVSEGAEVMANAAAGDIPSSKRIRTLCFLKIWVSGTLMCLFRNQGVYMVLAAVLILLVIWRKQIVKEEKRAIAVAFVLSAVSFLLINSVMMRALGAEKGNLREMLSIPMQQMAYVGSQDLAGEDALLTDEEMKQLQKYMPEDVLKAYEPDIADPVKAGFDTEAMLEDPGAFLNLYCTIGAKEPGMYFYALMELIAPNWDMTLNRFRYLSMTNTDDIVTQKWQFTKARDYFPAYREFLYDAVVENRIAEIPVLRWIMNPSLVLWIMVVSIGLFVCKKRRAPGIVQLLYFLYFGTLLLGPVALLRYLYPMILAVPLMTGLLFIED